MRTADIPYTVTDTIPVQSPRNLTLSPLQVAWTT